MNSFFFFFLQKKPKAKQLKNNKRRPTYELMGDVFWDSRAQGTFARLARETPLTDAKEREVGVREKHGSPNNRNLISNPSSYSTDGEDEAIIT